MNGYYSNYTPKTAKQMSVHVCEEKLQSVDCFGGLLEHETNVHWGKRLVRQSAFTVRFYGKCMFDSVTNFLSTYCIKPVVVSVLLVMRCNSINNAESLTQRSKELNKQLQDVTNELQRQEMNATQQLADRKAAINFYYQYRGWKSGDNTSKPLAYQARCSHANAELDFITTVQRAGAQATYRKSKLEQELRVVNAQASNIFKQAANDIYSIDNVDIYQLYKDNKVYRNEQIKLKQNNEELTKLLAEREQDKPVVNQQTDEAVNLNAELQEANATLRQTVTEQEQIQKTLQEQNLKLEEELKKMQEDQQKHRLEMQRLQAEKKQESENLKHKHEQLLQSQQLLGTKNQELEINCKELKEAVEQAKIVQQDMASKNMQLAIELDAANEKKVTVNQLLTLNKKLTLIQKINLLKFLALNICKGNDQLLMTLKNIFGLQGVAI